MSWETFHRRSEVLRRVSDEANRRRDGRLPVDLPGVRERFAGPTDLLAALQLRWYSHLSGAIELELACRTSDLEGAVVAAWCRTADDLSGVRLILDADLAAGRNLAAARQKEWELLGASAMRAAGTAQRTLAEGRRIENRARRDRAAALATQPVSQGTRRGHAGVLLSRRHWLVRRDNDHHRRGIDRSRPTR
jgi:hypothetical protein